MSKIEEIEDYSELSLYQDFSNFLSLFGLESAHDMYDDVTNELSEYCGLCESHHERCHCEGNYDLYDDGASYEE